MFARNIYLKYFLSVCSLTFHFISSIFKRAEYFDFDEIKCIRFIFLCPGIFAYPKVMKIFFPIFFWIVLQF